MAKPPRQTPLRWLHVADLHLAARPSADWEQGFEEVLRGLGLKGRPPGFDSVDLVLVSGDVADTGAPAEYARASEVFTRLLAALPCAGDGEPPLLVPVPGNHDLARPSGKAARAYKVLSAYHEGRGDPDVAGLRDELWEDGDAALVAPLFAPYSAWWDGFVRPQLAGRAELRPSFFPGDFSVRVALPDRPPLHLVGLNTAWLAYRDGQSLALEPDQLHAALGDAPLAALEGAHALLLLHHHPERLHSRGEFDAAIYPARRFLACLHGQAPARAIKVEAVGGGEARRWIPTYSLLGRTTCQVEDETRDRRQGFVWGELHHDGAIIVWPRRRFTAGDGERAFHPDIHVIGADEGVSVRPGRGPAPVEQPRTVVPRRDLPALDLTTFCQRTRDMTRFMPLDGIAAAPKAIRYPIERLYTRLRTHAHGEEGGPRGPVDLADLLHRGERLLIEGQPGSGKTTFLRLVASVLARDFLREPCPAGPSWRAAYLGTDVAMSLPVFLKVSELAELAAGARGEVRLLDHLVAKTAPPAGADARAARNARDTWDHLLREGEVTLLLDGLDEVGEASRREGAFAALEDVLRAWPRCRVVVASRPIDVLRLRDLNFAYASVAALGEADVQDYVDRWVQALYEKDPDKLRGAAEQEFAAGLFRTLRSGPELRRLASVPVMLTCLCVVYTHGGGLPEGRAELYRETLRWLLAAREELRAARYGFDPWHPLAALALAMMGPGGEGKRREFDLDRSAEVVSPMLERYFDTPDPPTRHAAIRGWIEFECQYSGVIEDVGRGRLQFKHLTFQEYLATARLAVTPNHGWWPVLRERLEDLQWRETVELFPGSLRGDEDLDFFVREVHGLWRDQPRLVRAARITAITGRCSPAFRAVKYKLPPDLARRDAELRAEAMAVFEIEGAAKLEESLRIAAAEAIGVAGDERLAAGRFVANLLPKEGPCVRLGKYPVTVEEFARFVAEDGYRRESLWVDADGWSFRSRFEWQAPDVWETQLGAPNRPVVRVSWFEAMAYCRWLSEEHPDWRVRLPTAAEWMAVASPDGRRYPWPGLVMPDETRANFGDRVTAPTPVGIYPAGNGPFGHCDLAGNVWEWCLDIDAGIEPIEGLRDWGPPRVLCGGSWEAGAEKMAAAMRFWSRSRLRIGDVGFRVAAEPTSA